MPKIHKQIGLIIYILFLGTAYAIETVPVTKPEQEDIPPALSGTIDVTTNYLSEGLSNTNNAPGIQGGLTYTFAKSGIYIDVWGSNADFIDPQFNHATVEFDTAIGIANPINDNWSYDIYLDRYNYPGASAAEYVDLIGILTYKIFSATFYYSKNVFGSQKPGLYSSASIIYNVPVKYIHFENISALATLGYYALPKDTGMNSYYNYMLGFQKKIAPFTLTLQWSDTSDANLYPFDGYHIVGTLLFEF